MSNTSHQGSASPGPSQPQAPFVASKPRTVLPPPKPVNVFSNDGSFLERFKKTSVEEQLKKSQDEALARKKALDDRIKNRGKRPAPSTADGEAAKKKVATETVDSAYKRQVEKLSGHNLKDEGVGIRPTLK
ncbi:hypothetical protein P7C70_g5188, partial [Phenoliferia sp. Uapishka_3]